ncbi:MAG: inorganic diphosphatase [Verrucomicrobia bacterium]|nr:inorganic diphosphatase [Verrucomicrobiota bacterium]
MNALQKLPPRNRKSGNLNVVIDTPKGCRNKFAFDIKKKAYLLKTVLPEGSVFPFDFGSIAGTKADDGDPLDALVLMDEPAFTGCLVEARAIGVIEAKQTEKGTTERNDRIVAVAAESHTHREIKSLTDLDSNLIQEIERFFISYNETRGKKFKPLGLRGPKRALKLVKKYRSSGKS